MEVRILRTLEAMEEVRDAWLTMQRSPESDIDFVSFIVGIRPEILRPHVIVVYREGKPVALVAGRIEQGNFEIKIGYKVLWRVKVRRLAVFYGGLMGEITAEVGEILVQRLVRSLREERADLLLWSGIQRNSEAEALLKRIPNAVCRDYLARPVQHWRMTFPASLEELLEQRMNKKHRYWLRRTMRMLDKEFPGAVRCACYSTPAEMGKLFEDTIQIASKTYQWGLGVGFRDTEEQRARLKLEAENKWLRGYVLYLRDQPAAFWICIVYQDIVYSAFTGYDPQYRKYEIGTALFLRMVGMLCREKANQLDFGPGTALYKERFGDSFFEEATVCVFAPTIRGVFLNGLRLLTEGPLQLVRGMMQRLGLEQKLKRAWRWRRTPTQAAKEPSQGQP